MTLRRLARPPLAALLGTVVVVVGSFALAPGAEAAPSGSLTSAVGVCSSKGPSGYGQVAVSGTFNGLTPSTSYQLELDEATSHASGRTTPAMTSATGEITFTQTVVFTGGLSSLSAGSATFEVLPTAATDGETVSGSVTVIDGDCTLRPTELVATPSLATRKPLHLYLFRLSATLTSDGVPVPGELISFTEPSSVLCNSNTDPRGVAYCQLWLPLSRLRTLLKAGGTYTAIFAGDPEGGYASSSSSAPLIGE